MKNTSPLPGNAVRGSSTGRPIMALLDQLGRRWTLRVIWELQNGPLTFRDLQQACDDASPSVLNSRLRELRKLQLVMHERGTGYSLSAQGKQLLEFFAPLNDWAEAWGKTLPS